jgi:metallo-beta-lactamase class B
VGVNPGTILVNNKDYPSIADDYARSFKVLRTMPVDVFLGAHGSFYGLQAKYAKLQAGGANPFIDPAGFKAYLDDKEKAFNTELAAQKSKQ